MSSCAAEHGVLAAARRQHGVITALQLRAAGVSRNTVAHRVRTGWLRRLYRGVYLVGPLVAPHTQAMAAVLAYSDGTLLSDDPAAVLWGFRPARPGPMHVTVTSAGAHSRPGIRVHRSHVHPADRTTRHQIPTTSPARTLLDLAATLPQRELDRAVEEAEVQRRVSLHSLTEQSSRYPAHRGTAALRKALRTDPAFTRSEAERRMLDLVRAARLPAPEVNAMLNGYEVDFLWRAHRLVVETDGYAFHSSRRAFERDRRRDRDLQAAGYVVLRITWRELKAHPEAVVAEVAAALTRRA